MSRRVRIVVTQTDVKVFDLEVPDDMADDAVLETFREDQIWASEEPHETIIDNQEMEVRPGNPDEQYPIRIHTDED